MARTVEPLGITQQTIDVLTYEEKPVKMISVLLGSVKGFPNDSSDDKYHDHYNLVVMYDGKATNFAFYESAANYGKMLKGADNLRDALDCFIGDALSGLMDFEEFCSEFGYDEDSRRAEKIHNLCKDSTVKASSIGWSEEDLYKISALIRGEQEE